MNQGEKGISNHISPAHLISDLTSTFHSALETLHLRSLQCSEGTARWSTAIEGRVECRGQSKGGGEQKELHGWLASRIFWLRGVTRPDAGIMYSCDTTCSIATMPTYLLAKVAVDKKMRVS